MCLFFRLEVAMTVKVIVAAHKPCEMPEDALYLPMQAGAALREPIGFKGDNSGDTISEKNGSYCELTCLYWGWKNLESDYIGLAHYRRHFSLKDKKPLTLEQAECLLKDTDILLPKKRKYYIENLYDHYAHTLEEAPLAEAGRIIAEDYPEYYPEFERLKKRTCAHMFNMMVMRKDIFDSYCEWLFELLSKLEKRVDVADMSTFEARFYGRVSELMLDIWLNTNGYSYKEIPFIYTEKVNIIKKGIDFLCAKFFKKKYDKSF